MNGFLLLRNIHVENANAIAGQTWGFPAITHFLGFTHALQRKLATHEFDDHQLIFKGCAVICHQLSPQTHQANSYAEHVFSLTRNPLTKEAKSPSFVEEGRANMTVSLLIAIDDLCLSENETQAFESHIQHIAQAQRLAGGTITAITKARLVNLKEGVDEQQQQVNFWLRTLLPGHVLVARPQLLADHSENFAHLSPTENTQESPTLAAWLDNSTLHRNANGSINSKPYQGWIRPITVGYKAISPLYEKGEVARSRDNQTPVQFVEYAYSLGEWLSPHRVDKIEQILWQYSTNTENGWYVCQNRYEQLTELETAPLTDTETH